MRVLLICLTGTELYALMIGPTYSIRLLNLHIVLPELSTIKQKGEYYISLVSLPNFMPTFLRQHFHS